MAVFHWKVFWREHPRFRLFARLAALAAMIGIITGALFAILIMEGAFGPIPSYAELRQIRNATASEIYSADGRVLGKYYIENRVNAHEEEIPAHVINALIATEDARYFEHQGVDLRAFLRVVVKSILLFDESAGGGSTLSQQLAKNLYPRQDVGILSLPVAKVKEMLTARRLENLYTKEELLNLYLNTVPFGENVYGIKVASRRFFNKAPEQLRVEEAAVLVGLLKANTFYNPVRNPEHATRRRNIVLAQMHRYGYLTAEEKDSLQNLPLHTDYRPDSRHRGLAVYFRSHLRQQVEAVLQDLRKPDGSSYRIDADGLKIHTTIDARLQRYAEMAAKDHLASLQKALRQDWAPANPPWEDRELLEAAIRESERYRALKQKGMNEEQIAAAFRAPRQMTVYDGEAGHVTRPMSPLDSIRHHLATLNAGMLAADPATGAVKVWVGGVDYRFFPYDHVLSQRQVGSTFKPIVYAAALESGMLPCEYIPNQLVSYVEYQGWEPRNADDAYGGVYSLEGALTHSVNTVSAALIDRLGTGRVVELAEAMGIRSEVPALPAIALGAVEASLWDMVQAYGTLANRGRRPGLFFLSRIETADGRVLFEADTDAQPSPQVLPAQTAGMITHMLESVVDSGTARRLRLAYHLPYALAGKTGTTQNHTDGWFIGYTPQLVAGVWVGADNPRVHFRTLTRGQGANTALPVFGKFMQHVYRDPAFAQWQAAQFPPLADSLRLMLQCPPYLEQMPLLAEQQDAYADMPILVNRLLEELTDEVGLELDIQLKRQRRNESDEEYYERMRRYNERRLERQERRKAKNRWVKWLFGKKNE